MFFIILKVVPQQILLFFKNNYFRECYHSVGQGVQFCTQTPGYGLQYTYSDKESPICRQYDYVRKCQVIVKQIQLTDKFLFEGKLTDTAKNLHASYELSLFTGRVDKYHKNYYRGDDTRDGTYRGGGRGSSHRGKVRGS